MNVVFALALGALTWSLLEYCIHRWMGHDRRFIRNPFGREHTAHHSQGDYFAPWWKKVVAAAGAIVVLGPPIALLTSLTISAAYLSGLVGLYLVYEVLHRLEHVHAGFGRYGRWARRHHFYHHFHDPKKNHGVTSPLWDHIFGTHVRPGVIRVPEKLAMRWLLDPTTGDVRSEHAGRYQLRRSKRHLKTPRAEAPTPSLGALGATTR